MHFYKHIRFIEGLQISPTENKLQDHVLGVEIGREDRLFSTFKTILPKKLLCEEFKNHTVNNYKAICFLKVENVDFCSLP